MAALDRPSNAFDGTPVSGVKRSASGPPAVGSADPRREGGPSRARSKLRAEFGRRTSESDSDTGPLDRPPVIDPTPAVGDSIPPTPFDWVDTDTGAQAALAPPAIDPAVPTIRNASVIDAPPAMPTGVVPVVVRPAEPPVAPAPAPAGKQVVARTTVGRRSKPRVRRVRRVVRSIDTWTVFKLSVLFYLVLYAILLVAGVLLWNLAYATGTIDNLENFFESFGWETFRFQGGEIFHSAWIGGLFLVAGGTGLHVVAATVFNLMADLVGGIGVTVLEEEVRVVPDTDVGQRRSA